VQKDVVYSRNIQLVLDLDVPGVKFKGGEKVLCLEGKHAGKTGIISLPARGQYRTNLVVFRGRNNLGSYTRSQLFLLRSKKW
jgi:ribosomal protein S4E